jgi:hypothetical protein
MTGCDAIRNGALNVSSGRSLLRTDFRTLPELLLQGGYATAIFGKWHLGENHPYRPQDRGFEEVVTFPSSHIGSVPDYWLNDYLDDTYLHNGVRQEYRGYTTEVFFDEAPQWMRDKHIKQQTFFAYIATAAPHSPHYTPLTTLPSLHSPHYTPLTTCLTSIVTPSRIDWQPRCHRCRRSTNRRSNRWQATNRRRWQCFQNRRTCQFRGVAAQQRPWEALGNGC